MDAVKPIWEQCGITLDEYAQRFDKALNEAFERHLASKLYCVNFVDSELHILRVANITNVES